MNSTNEQTTVHRYCGWDFTRQEIDRIRELIAAEPPLNRAQLSRHVCDELHWVRPDGTRKDMSCFIGWTTAQREHNLHRVVNNARFLILPWVEVQNLASTILARTARRIAQDWKDRYGFEPVLLETFVDTERFRATCYRAANWIHVGQTQGRGKLNKTHIRLEPIKDIFLQSLTKHFRHTLCYTR